MTPQKNIIKCNKELQNVEIEATVERGTLLGHLVLAYVEL